MFLGKCDEINLLYHMRQNAKFNRKITNLCTQNCSSIISISQALGTKKNPAYSRHCGETGSMSLHIDRD